ncbi:unnamed protein product [Onchocerca ochengi]|uniref:Secreted protein n=2 Tax=Onchocerca TaxID=6281 RepID=A0A182ED05_ONCOC|nr:unnamed protein product [Onchocerca ochengi]
MKHEESAATMKVTQFPFFTSPLMFSILGALILLTTSQLNPPGFGMENNPRERIIEVITFVPDDLSQLCLELPQSFKGREVRVKLTAPRFDDEDIQPNYPIDFEIISDDDDVIDPIEESDDNDVDMVDREE